MSLASQFSVKLKYDDAVLQYSYLDVWIMIPKEFEKRNKLRIMGLKYSQARMKISVIINISVLGFY